MAPGTLAVCIREVQKSLMQSSKRLIETKIQQLGVGDQFKILHDRIVTPGDGLIIFQGMQDATAESIKSLEGFRTAGAVLQTSKRACGRITLARIFETLSATLRARWRGITSSNSLTKERVALGADRDLPLRWRRLHFQVAGDIPEQSVRGQGRPSRAQSLARNLLTYGYRRRATTRNRTGLHSSGCG
jgi:Phage terminase large subunit